MKYSTKLVAFVFVIFSLFSSVSFGFQKEDIAKTKQNKSSSFLQFNTKEILVTDGQQKIKKALNITDQIDLVKNSEFNDRLGFTHKTYQCHFNGYPIEGAEIKLHYKNGKLVSANGVHPSNINVTNSFSLNSTVAKHKAVGYINAKDYVWTVAPFLGGGQGPTLEKVIIYHNGVYKYVYKVDVYAITPLSRDYVYVDASNGSVIKKVSRLRHANTTGTATTKYSGIQTITVDSINPTTYILRDYTRGDSIITMDLNNGFTASSSVDFVDTDNNWNNVNAAKDEAATDAHWAAEKFYDYFNITHGRNSIDDAGAALQSYVHYFTNYDNAFWDGTEVMIGDGNGTTTNPHTAIDIVSHEFCHGLITNTANLNGSFEPGALAESYCDIFATIIEFYAKSATANYTIGEDVSTTATPLRSLINPNTYGQPDTYYGTNWATGSADNGGVHTNGGVQNFWFYLLVNGGSGTNDNAEAYTVAGIGMTKAAAIIYRALTVYLTASSQYADARAYTIQAAEDLYGCNAEVAAVADAWHAVGIGNAFSNSAVTAGFSSDITTTCHLPATINFIDQSTNGVNYIWYFGDGNSSTDPNPTYTYTAVGNYDVKQVVSSTGTCGTTADSVTVTSYISITGSTGPIPPSCQPATTAYCCGRGITNVTIGTINNTTADGSDGYQDYACSLGTDITAGSMTNIAVTTGAASAEDVRVWIDFNDDGVFNNTDELVFQSDNIVQNHSGTFLAPAVPLNTALRMRVASDYFTNTISNACQTMVNGQVEDYTVTLIANTNPPIADFTSDKQVANIGEIITFQDISQNIPTSWDWDLVGSSQTTSTAQNPGVTYSTLGNYTAKLRVDNSFGADSITKVNYITIVDAPYLMCTSAGSTAPNGDIHDSGGNTGNYANNENCGFLIDVGCVTNITLTFSAMAIESGWDYLYVYDGVDQTGTLLQTYTGFTVPTTPLIAASGTMYLFFDSDGSVIEAGFEASWVSAGGGTITPVANVSASDLNPSYGVQVDFNDNSANDPGTWLWDFGDGSTSTLQNPSYTYAAAGTYNVNVTVSNCIGYDAAALTITMQTPPTISITTDTIFVTQTVCTDTMYAPLTISNIGTGDLSYNIFYLGSSYDSTIALNYTGSGTSSNLVFDGLSSGLDSLYLTVTINGDFDNTTEYCDLYIDGQFIQQIVDGNVTNGTNIVTTYAFGPSQVNGWVADGVVTVTLDNSAAVDAFVGTEDHIATLRYSDLELTTSGIVAQGADSIAYIGIPIGGQITGTYSTEVIVSSNDPTNSNILIPVVYTIVGYPVIEMSDTCLNYGNVFTGSTVTDSLIVFNTGCDTLWVSNITSDKFSPVDLAVNVCR